MRSILTALLVGCFCLPLVSCNEEEVDALKEQNAKLQRQLDELAAAQKAKAEKEAAALAKAEEEKAAALAKAEEEKAKAAEEAKEQSASLKQEVLAIAKQMADKEYDCSGVFYTSDAATLQLLKRNGYDEDLRQPSKDVAHYVDLFKATLASHPKAENQPSLVKFNELAQQWADYQKDFLQGFAVGSAGVNSSFARLQDAGRGTLREAKTNKANAEKEFLDSIEALFN